MIAAAHGATDSMASEVRQLLRRGTAAYETGEYAEAEAVLLRVLDQHPDYANVHHMLGVIASLRGAPEKAVEYFRQALALNPQYIEAQLSLAITLADMGAYEEAAVEANKLQDREPAAPGRLSPAILGRLANAHAELGRKYQALGLHREAVSEFDKAIGHCSNFPDIHHLRAVSCRELGDYAGAEGSLTRALELNPRYVEAYVNLGQVHQQMGRRVEAIAAWTRALDLMPAHPLARIYLAQATALPVAEG